MTYLSIPCTFENDTLTIKGLRLSHKASDPQVAYLESIKNMKGLYAALAKGTVEKYTDSLKRTFYSVEMPYDAEVYSYIDDLEPVYVEKKKKKASNHLIDASPEEVLKLGY